MTVSRKPLSPLALLCLHTSSEETLLPTSKTHQQTRAVPALILQRYHLLQSNIKQGVDKML